MTAAEQLEALSLNLPEVPEPAAAYVPWIRDGANVVTSGQLPMQEGVLMGRGLVGTDVTVPEAQSLAKICALNLLAIADQASEGRLDECQFLKISVFVASAPTFTEQHLVANGASLFLADILGDRGVHARSAVGVPRLPLDSPVEIEAIIRMPD